MILFRNPSLPLARGAETTLLRVNPEQPVARSARRVLEALMTPDFATPGQAIHVLELGCRDGAVSAELQRLIAERTGNGIEKVRWFGLDPSSVAIVRAQSDHPAIGWINDTPGEWLRRDTSRRLHDSFDLVIDRGYPSLIDSPEQAARDAAGIAAMLAPGGVVVELLSRNAYAEWAHLACVGWERSLQEIRAAVLGAGLRVDDADCYVTVRGEVTTTAGLVECGPLPGSSSSGSTHTTRSPTG